MKVTRTIIFFVVMGAGVAALVVGLTTIEGSEAISTEAGYQPVMKQKQQNETETNRSPVPDVPQYGLIAIMK